MTIYRRFGLNDRQIEILARRYPSATITASPAAAIACSSWAWARSRSPSPPPRRRPTRPRLRTCLPRHGRAGFAAAWLARKGISTGRRNCSSRPEERPCFPLPLRRLSNEGSRHSTSCRPGRRLVPRASPASAPAAGKWSFMTPRITPRTSAAGRPRAAADQQPDHQPAELDADASQPGEEPDQPAIFGPASDRAKDRRGPSSSSIRPSASPTISVRSIGRSSLSIRRAMRAWSTPSTTARRRRPDTLAELAGRIPGCTPGPGRCRWQALDTSRTETNGLVASSQSAVGILQASQAGNQLIALQTRQLVDLTALIAAQSRAQSLEGARLTCQPGTGARSAQSVSHAVVEATSLRPCRCSTDRRKRSWTRRPSRRPQLSSSSSEPCSHARSNGPSGTER